MTNQLYNQKTVANTTAVTTENQGVFLYKGFHSQQSSKNYFYIRKGEKLENPEFGTVIWDMLFENFTEEVKQIIAKDVEAIVNYDPRVTVNSVAIDSTDQGIRIQADIVYLPFNVNERMTFDFDKTNNMII